MLLASAASAQPDPDSSWPHYGNDAGGARYSAAAQIDRTNVDRLQRRVDVPHRRARPERRRSTTRPPSRRRRSWSTACCSQHALRPRARARPADRRQALGASTPTLDRSHGYSEFTSRGVAAWRGRGGRRRPRRAGRGSSWARSTRGSSRSTPTPARPAPASARAGRSTSPAGVDLRDLRQLPDDLGPRDRAAIVVIVGSAIGDNRAVDMPSAASCARFDARSGALRWTWDPIPWAEPRTHAAHRRAATRGRSSPPTRRAISSSCRPAARAPTTTAATRTGDNRYANSVVALRAAPASWSGASRSCTTISGTTTSPSQPALFDLREDGTPRDRVRPPRWATSSCSTARPASRCFPVEERPVPPSDVPGEEASPTQPFPPASRSCRERLARRGRLGRSRRGIAAWCREKIAALRTEGIFTPPSLQGTRRVPGQRGRHELGQRRRSIRRATCVFVNTDQPARSIVRLIPRADFERAEGAPAAAGSPCASSRRRRARPTRCVREPLLSPVGTALQPAAVGHARRAVTSTRANGSGRCRSARCPTSAAARCRSGPLPAVGCRTSAGRIVTAGRPRLHRGRDGRLPARLRRRDRRRAVERPTCPPAGNATPDDVPRRAAGSSW